MTLYSWNLPHCTTKHKFCAKLHPKQALIHVLKDNTRASVIGSCTIVQGMTIMLAFVSDLVLAPYELQNQRSTSTQAREEGNSMKLM